VVFGKEDILINNIAFILRRLPVFGIPGSGSYNVCGRDFATPTR
jgi:NADH dehydrogenase